MKQWRRGLSIDVLEAARRRVSAAFDDFDRLYVSFSAGKDSTVLLHLVADEARRRGRMFGLLLVDLEAQYRLTIQHGEECFDLYADCIDPYWVALPLALRNAVSMYEPKWECWDPGERDRWVRRPPKRAVTDAAAWPWFRRGMEFEEFVPAFGEWYSGCGKRTTGCFVGIRTAESLNRWRALVSGRKSPWRGWPWSTWKGGSVFNLYPIYDWRAEDVWTFHARYPGLPYNRLYDRMQAAGLTVHQARICQPYGDDQRRGLWLYHVIEPETWGRVVARVSGANGGALYCREPGNVLGQQKIAKPPGHTWESFAKLLLATLPRASRLHFENKVAVFLKWHADRGYPGGIPDCADPAAEARKDVPSWRRVCKALLRNDWWCKGLSFSQTKPESYARYLKVMEKRRRRWRLPM